MTGPRILVVEDDELNQALVRAIVARSSDPLLRGAEVIAAGSLAQARASLAAKAVDVVLLDMHLPDGSGLDLADELRGCGGSASPTVIAVTGAPGEHVDAAGEAGYAEVLGKPYHAEQLLRLLAEHLRRRRTD